MSRSIVEVVERGWAWSRPLVLCLAGAALALSGCAHAGAAGGDAKTAADQAGQQAAAQADDHAAAPDETADADEAEKPESGDMSRARARFGEIGESATTRPDLSSVKDPEPPEGESWQKDETGREYFLDKLPKSEEWYRLAQQTNFIRYRKYEMYEVDHEDEDYFYVRRYRRTGETTPSSFEPTDEDLAAIEATYDNDTGEADRFRFVDFGAGLPRRGQWRNGFDVADMNEDGKLDIVHGMPRKVGRLPIIFLGDGAGHWQGWKDTLFPPMSFAYGDAAAADLDGDGLQDLVLAMHVQGVTALRGDGAGGFTRWDEGMDYWEHEAGSEPGFSSRSVTVADWNGDGRPDVIALGEGPRPARDEVRGVPSLAGSAFGVVVYLNHGDGTWSRKALGADSQLFGDSLALADFNGDGRLDIATGSNTTGLRGIVHYGEADGGWRTQDLDVLRRRVLVRSVAAADFDADGRQDLAIAYSAFEGRAWHNGVDLLLSRPGETWERQPLTVHENQESFYALAAGDLDGDGRPDLVTLDGSGGTRVFSATADGWVREKSPEIPDVEQGCRGYRVRLVDLDGDGRDEMVEEFAGEPSALFAPLSCRSQGAMRAWKVDPSSLAANP